MFEYILIFILGTIVGSFLNALLWRLSVGESVLRGRSYCTDCRHPLASKDLVPLISFFTLRRRCRYCSAKISWRYPIIETSAGVLFVLVYAVFVQSVPEGLIQSFFFGGHNREILMFALNVFFASALLALFVYDLRWSLLPDAITIPAIVVGVVVQAVLYPSALPWYGLAVLVGAGFFAAQYIVSRGVWIGGGDIRLGALMGVILGWPGVLLALFISYIAGAVIAIFLLALKLKNRKSEIPFAPFLTASTFIVLLYGEGLIRAIRNFYGL